MKTQRWERLNRWRLNAPAGYRWDDEDVLYEKGQSFANGLIAGALFVLFLIIAITAVLG